MLLFFASCHLSTLINKRLCLTIACWYNAWWWHPIQAEVGRIMSFFLRIYNDAYHHFSFASSIRSLFLWYLVVLIKLLMTLVILTGLLTPGDLCLCKRLQTWNRFIKKKEKNLLKVQRFLMDDRRKPLKNKKQWKRAWWMKLYRTY